MPVANVATPTSHVLFLGLTPPRAVPAARDTQDLLGAPPHGARWKSHVAGMVRAPRPGAPLTPRPVKTSAVHARKRGPRGPGAGLSRPEVACPCSAAGRQPCHQLHCPVGHPLPDDEWLRCLLPVPHFQRRLQRDEAAATYDGLPYAF